MEDPEHFEPPKTSEATSSLSIPDCSSGCPDLPAFCFFFCTTVKGRDFGRRFLIFTSAVPSALLFDNISQLEKIKIKIKNSREQIMEQIDARSQQKMARCVQSSFTLRVKYIGGHWIFSCCSLNLNLIIIWTFHTYSLDWLIEKVALGFPLIKLMDMNKMRNCKFVTNFQGQQLNWNQKIPRSVTNLPHFV